MKKLFSVLLSMMLLLSMAGAENASENAENLNMGHLIELTQRVDVLLRSDRMVSDNVSVSENAISEEHMLLTRLRKGERTMPSAVYAISQEEMEAKLIGDNPDYTATTSQVMVMTDVIRSVLTEKMSEYEYELTSEMARATNYLLAPGEDEVCVCIVLYDEALPMLVDWYTEDGVVTMGAYPLFDEDLAACTTPEEVTAWFVAQELPDMTCTLVDLSNAAKVEFDDHFFTEEGEPLSFELLSTMADEMEQKLQERYLQITWGYTDENVAMMDDFRHGDEQPTHIYRLDVMNTSTMQMTQFFYRSEVPQVQYEAMCSNVGDMQLTLLYDMQYDLYSRAYETYYNSFFSDDDEEGSLVEEEEQEDIFTDEETMQERFNQYLEDVENQQMRYVMAVRLMDQRAKVDLSESVPAIYLLVYETGAPVFIVHTPESGIHNLDTSYLYVEQLQRCKSISDVKLYLNTLGLTCQVTEILPEVATEPLVE